MIRNHATVWAYIRIFFCTGLVLAALLSLTGCEDQRVVVELPDFTRLAEQAAPAVVNISSTREVDERDFSQAPQLPGDNPLEDFFRRFFEGPHGGPEQGGEEGLPPFAMPRESLGSGFIVSEEGHVLTNAHVVQEAEEIVVRLSDRREFVAELVGTDRHSDIALLKIEADDLPMVRIGDVKDLKVGAWVLAIGSPFGFDHSVTAGIVSAKRRSLSSDQYVPFIQTDVAINPGNSGGPLFNLQGEVIGINSQIYSRTGGYMGLSFAVPIDVAMNVMQQLRKHGKVARGWLGVIIQEVDRSLAESFGLDQPRGALVARVVGDSPAADAGFKAGDVILRFDGRKVPTSSALPPMVGSVAPGTKAEVEILRDGERKTLNVEIGDLAESGFDEAAGPPVSDDEAEGLGIGVRDLSPQERRELNLESGGVLVIRVQSGPAQRAGLRRGDVILQVGGETVADAAQFRRLMQALPESGAVPLLVQRGEQRQFIPLER